MLMELQEIFQKWINRIRGKETTTLYYTGVVLTYFDRLRLISRLRSQIPKGWKIVAHHMTINLGKADEGPVNPERVGERVALQVVSIAQDDKVMAVGVSPSVESNNEKPHITIAVGPGGTPKDSNDLVDWKPISPMTVRGTIKEVPKEVEAEPGKEKVARDPSAPAPASDDPVEFVRKDMVGKPEGVIKIAMKGKFPTLSDEEIDAYINQAKNPETS